MLGCRGSSRCQNPLELTTRLAARLEQRPLLAEGIENRRQRRIDVPPHRPVRSAADRPLLATTNPVRASQEQARAIALQPPGADARRRRPTTRPRQV